MHQTLLPSSKTPLLSFIPKDTQPIQIHVPLSYEHFYIPIALFLIQSREVIRVQSIIFMHTVFLDRSDDLELGQIPNPTLENKPKKDSPLARLFFDTPSTLPLNNETHDTPPEEVRHRNETSNSPRGSEEGRGKDRSRSRDKRRNPIAVNDVEETLKKKNRRLPKKNGVTGKHEGSNSSQGSQVTPNEALNTVLHQQQSLALIQKPPNKQSNQSILEVKQSNEVLHPQKQNDRSGSVKLNNTNFDRFFKTRICPQFQAGFCERNLRCTYAHGEKELREVQSSRSGPYKTKTCNNFEKGLCHKRKEDCNYAHGKEDLRVGRHQDQNERNQPKSHKIQNHNPHRTIPLGQKNQKRDSTSAGRQGKNDQDQSRRQHTSNKNTPKPEIDLNDKYSLTQREQNFPNDKFTPQPMRIPDYYMDPNYANPSDPNAANFHNKNLMGNGYYGGYYPPAFVQGQSQMQGYTMPGMGEGYPNYYVPYYPCYPPMQPHMNFYPSFANFPNANSNSAAFNSPRAGFEYVNGCTPGSATPENNGAALRGDSRQNGRRSSRNEQQHTSHF